MVDTTYVVPRMDDHTLLKLFQEIIAKFGPPENAYVHPSGLDRINFQALNDQTKPVIEYLDKSGSYLIREAGVHFPHFGIRYFRSGADPARARPYDDEFRVNNSDNQAGGPEPLKRLEIMAFLASKIPLTRPSSGLPMPDEAVPVENLESVYRSTVLKLERSFAEQIEKITNWTVEQTSALEQSKLRLADETNAEREALRQEYESKRTELKENEDALEEKRKELDDRAYMHARRAIRNDLRQIIKDREKNFSLTKNTRQLRWPVHAAMFALLAVLMVINGVFLLDIARINISAAPMQVLLWTFGKQSIATVAFIATLLFYVRWMNRWFEQHAAAEFLLKQFELDIDRASWVVETAMEWRRDQKSEIPAPLLEGMTRNLFADRAESSGGHSAADDLASALVGNASQLKMKLGENELSFDRKGLAGLAKAEEAR